MNKIIFLIYSFFLRFLYLINNYLFFLLKLKFFFSYYNFDLPTKNKFRLTKSNYFLYFLFFPKINFYKVKNLFFIKKFYISLYKNFVLKPFFAFYSLYFNSNIKNNLYFYKFSNNFFFLKKFVKIKKKNFFFIQNFFLINQRSALDVNFIKQTQYKQKFNFLIKNIN